VAAIVESDRASIMSAVGLIWGVDMEMTRAKLGSIHQRESLATLHIVPNFAVSTSEHYEVQRNSLQHSSYLIGYRNIIHRNLLSKLGSSTIKLVKMVSGSAEAGRGDKRG
jgi:hypothetical protein